jgi:hypothetical protein
VDGLDRRLELEGTRVAAPDALPHQFMALPDQWPVPKSPVLLSSQDHIVMANLGRNARLPQEHQRQEPERLRLVRHQTRQNATALPRRGEGCVLVAGAIAGQVV